MSALMKHVRDSLNFLGVSEMGAMMRTYDWSQSPVGAPASWSTSLRTTVAMLLGSRAQIVLFWGPEFCALYNDAYAPQIGDKHPRALGRPAVENWTELWEDLEPLLAGVRNTGETFSAKDRPFYIERGQGGETTYWDVSYSSVPDDDGAIGGVLCIVSETTERILAANALAASEARLRAVIEAVPVGLTFADARGRLTGRNAQADQLLARPPITPADGDPRRNWESLHADGRQVEAHEYPLPRVIENGEERPELEALYRRGDGRDIWIRFIAAPVRDGDGELLGAVVASLDIDRERRAEAELRSLNAELESEARTARAQRDRVWHLSTDLMLVARLDGVIEAVNPAWTALLGWESSDLIGRSLLTLIHPDDLAHTRGGVRNLSGGQTLNRFENRYLHKDGGYRSIVWTAVPGDGIISAIGRDVTLEREQAETLSRTEDQLRQSQKMEAVGQLTGGLAHDFNNLLAAIIGGLELLQLRVRQGRLGELDRFITSAQGAASRAAALTHRLLAFSRRQTLDPKPTDVGRLAAGLEDLIRRTVGPAIKVDMIADQDLWPTLVDQGQLENAIINLGVNARDAMPEGGRLKIETENRTFDERAGRERDLPAGQYISVCVTDTGEGMPAEVVARAFDPFFTTKPLGVGTGLGLSMVHGFVRQSGGSARIRSRPGKGTTVCLYLPRHHGSAETNTTSERVFSPEPAQQNRTVLVVDDEPAVRMLVTEVLQECGYAVVEAAEGAAALRIVRSPQAIDLMVTDVGLPGNLNGRQVADAARALRPELQVLFITGYAEGSALGAHNLGSGMHVLTKPFAIQALADRVVEIMSG